MKYKRKCVCCNKLATKRLGRRDFCDDCFKEVKQAKGNTVFKEVLVQTWKDLKIYRDIPLRVFHKKRG